MEKVDGQVEGAQKYLLSFAFITTFNFQNSLVRCKMVVSFYGRKNEVEIKQLKVTQLPDSKVGIQTQFQYLVLSVPDSVLGE